MIHVFLLLALLLGVPAEPRSVEGQGKPAARPRDMDETEVDSLAASMERLESVYVAAIDGVPAEARLREAFLKGFHEAFGEKTLATERVARKTGAATAGEPLLNHMQLVVDDDGARWLVRVAVQWLVPPPDSTQARGSPADSLARAWPGLGVHVKLEIERNEDSPGRGAKTVPVEQWLRLPAGHPVDAAYYQHAARQVALVALETLHRPGGWLDDNQRLMLEDARREPAAAAR
jgi:hypothetical protein